MKRFLLLPITLGTLGLAACSDTTAPVPEAQRSFQPTEPNKNVSIVTGSSTDQFAITACNGELVTGTATHRIVAINAVGKQGTLDAVAVLDQLNGTGVTTKASYTGFQLTANAALISPELTAFTTVSALTLKGAGKIPDTYVDVVTLFAMDDDGHPAVSKVYYNTRCTTGGGSHHS